MNINNEYSTEFDKLRKSRVEVSFYKYGAARDNFGSGRVDAIGSLELCLEKFKKTGEYFKTTDSSESAGTVGTPINMER